MAYLLCWVYEHSSIEQHAPAVKEAQRIASLKAGAIRAKYFLPATFPRRGCLSVFRFLHLIFTWGSLGHLGQSIFIGFKLPQVFREYLGHLGQSCFTQSQGVQKV